MSLGVRAIFWVVIAASPRGDPPHPGWGAGRTLRRPLSRHAPNLPTKILDFRGFDSSIILDLRGGILMSIGEFPGNLESMNLSRDNLSREIGRTLSPSGRSVHEGIARFRIRAGEYWIVFRSISNSSPPYGQLCTLWTMIILSVSVPHHAGPSHATHHTASFNCFAQVE